MRGRQAEILSRATFGIIVLCASVLAFASAQDRLVPLAEVIRAEFRSLAEVSGATLHDLMEPVRRFELPEVPTLQAKLDANLGPSSREPLDEASLGTADPSAGMDSARILGRRSERDLDAFSEAIGFYKAGDLARGDSAARRVDDRTLKIALEWIALRKLPREAGFERLRAFAEKRPDWPGLPWLRKRAEEALLGDRRDSDTVKSFFAGNRPQTPAGKLALAKVLMLDGRTAEATALVRSVWREDDVNNWLEAKIRSDFGAVLDRADHKLRADRLLYKGQAAAAMRAANLAGADILALAKARAAVFAEAPSDRPMAAVPAALRSDPGYLFAQAQRLRRADKIREAADILLGAPRDATSVIDGDAWWVERRLLARKLLDRADPQTAYEICADHSAVSTPMQIDAEFHAGWIALRFLNDPARAAKHFDKAAAVAETPVSRARVAYWQGRAAEASPVEGASAVARRFYESAAAHPATYYGQLARAKLGLKSIPIRTIADEARGEARDEAILVVELLYALGEKDLAEPLVMEAVRHLTDARQVAALGTVVAAQADARLSLAVGKIASQRGFPLDTLAFPVYGVPPFVPLRNSVPPSVVYAIARQESAFNAKAVSSAGAKGLMQMMTATARRTAERAAVAFDESRLLADAAFNAQLAAAHLGDLLHEQRGSYILAFAAYNAGGRRVKEWVEAYGDPRKPEVDPIDWIERIPFTETRNYVQRVTENLRVYRARFGESSEPPHDPILRIEAKL